MPPRRRFLALAAGASAGLAAGCSTPQVDRAEPTPGASESPGSGGGAAGGASSAGGSGGGTAGPATGLDVRAENALPGDADWKIAGPATPRTSIEGFADRASVVAGGSFGLYVTSSVGPFTVRAYRLGWYGGAGARLVWTSKTLTGRRQSAPQVDHDTRMVRTRWASALEIDTSGWPEGSYLLRLDAERNAGRRFVPITVASQDVRGRTVIMNAPSTWQAYNTWGGHSLYQGPDGTLATRSLQVGLSRPYDHYHGAGLFGIYEQPLIAFAEKLGLSLGYLTGIDIATRPGVLHGATAMVSPGHDEYWSPQQRRAVTAARDAGVNLAVLGANACYRRVRLEPADDQPGRVVVCYKGDYALDPVYRHGGAATNEYRNPPDRDPESHLLGVLYEGFPADEAWTVADPKAWLFEGTQVAEGDSFAHLVGIEFDRVNTAYPTPRPMHLVGHGPVRMATGMTHHDSGYATFPAGAGVFATGTMRWVEALMAKGPGKSVVYHGMDQRTGDFVRRVSANVLTAFAAGPVGHQHPAVDNVHEFYS